jgi:hypothetical protein
MLGGFVRWKERRILKLLLNLRPPKYEAVKRTVSVLRQPSFTAKRARPRTNTNPCVAHLVPPPPLAGPNRRDN